ncbi:tenascin-R [Bactrocera dorsalis]|uniref:Tenascin-R n=1 Tax=Bactrocera dorsalis TaxID=27457 RepID=A0A6I9V5G6_BACDO|nr:tenascin-R [Bactrocera dorsalis]
MRTHLRCRRHNSGAFLSALLLLTFNGATTSPSPGGHTTSFEQLFSTDPNNATFTPLCDDAQLRNVAQQVAQLKISSENIFLLLDSYNLRLDYIKTLLDERLPEVKSNPHWIDVRGGGESISSTHTSTGGVVFPTISTQSSASGANIPAASSQSSAGGVDLPVITTQSSAGGVNIPATDSQSSAGGANLPATDSQSATGGSDIASPTTDASSSCGCNAQTSFKSGLYGALCPYSNPVLPPTCAEAVKRAGANAKSGIYHLYLPDSGLKPFYAYCLLDTNGGPAWTVVQRRQDGSISFHRHWDEYQAGFGNWNGEYFIGLERLHGITHATLNELWVQMEDFDNVTRYARYENFAIGDEHEAYALNVLGKFEGNAGDSLRTSQGQKFSTKDADHDMWDRNCAEVYTGAWWYNACHDSNLNGQYLRGKYSKDKYGKGIDWTHWHGHEYSLKYVHMAVRPVQ